MQYRVAQAADLGQRTFTPGEILNADDLDPDVLSQLIAANIIGEYHPDPPIVAGAGKAAKETPA